MQKTPFLASLLSSALALSPLRAPAARGDDFVDQSIPNKWIAPLLPEKLDKLDYQAYQKELDRAKLEVFTGRYKLALITLKKAKNADPVEAALVRGAALAATGKKDDAVKALSEPGPVADSPRCQVLRARVLAEQAKEKEAIALLKRTIAKHPDHVAAHFYLGQICEKVGDTDGALEAYAFFEPYIDKLAGAESFDDGEVLTLIGRGIDRWATLNVEYPKRIGLNNTVLTKCFGAVYLGVDREYWPAKVAAAEFYLARDDQRAAFELLKQVVQQNPNDAYVLTLLGRLELDRLNFDAADKAVEAIRQVDPDSIEAGLLETRNWLAQRRPKDAMRTVLGVLDRQPSNLEAMGLCAAVYALQLKDKEQADVLAKVDTMDPGNWSAYFECAEQLGSMRQYPRAEKMYRTVLERAPWSTAAFNGLGVLYTQSGDEDKAFAALEQARLLDPYNYATTNYLRLLDDMKSFERKETDHFVIVYDPKADPIIPEYFAEYLESIYKDVTGHFKHEPPLKTYIEVFPTQDAFAVRTHGMPELAATGASTGRVIALVSPRKGKRTQGTFDWATVLRHEFVHTVTLSATELRIAHWMTEGLATCQERWPLRREWGPMLWNAVKKKQLFTLEDLTFAFWRPKRPSDRMLAYAQSYWVCSYIEEKYGHDKMLALLEDFRKGAEQTDAFPKILGIKIPDFEKAFFAWAEKQTDGWGYDEETGKKFTEITTQGEALVKARQFEEAVKVWEEAAKLRPLDVLPQQRLAGLYLQLKQPDKAVPHLERLHRVELSDNRWAKRISRLYRDLNQLDKAVEFGMQGVYINPYDTDAHELLVELYEKTGNTKGLEREKRVLGILEDFGKSGDKDADRATSPG